MMVNKVWARVAIGGLAMGMVGCSSAAPTGTGAPVDTVNPSRSVQATENTLNPDALRAALPESIPVSEAGKRLVKIDQSQITGITPPATKGSDRSVQQIGWRGRGWGGRWGGRWGGLGWGGRWGGLGLGGLGWRGGWGGLGWGGAWSGYGLRAGWGDLGYFPYVTQYYPVGGSYYPYYQHGDSYHPYYATAGTFYSMPGLQPTGAGLYNTFSYNWY